MAELLTSSCTSLKKRNRKLLIKIKKFEEILRDHQNFDFFNNKISFLKKRIRLLVNMINDKAVKCKKLLSIEIEIEIEIEIIKKRLKKMQYRITQMQKYFIKHSSLGDKYNYLLTLEQLLEVRWKYLRNLNFGIIRRNYLMNLRRNSKTIIVD